MYFSNRKIRGYNAPIEIILTRRGRGKTFGEVRESLQKAIYNPIDHKFIYVVENDNMIKTLVHNAGERFFSNIIKYYTKEQTSNKNKFMLSKLTKEAVVIHEDNNLVDSAKTINASIKSGTIIVDGVFVGYILSLNSFANIKRNNFAGFTKIIIDEFVPEKITLHNYDNPRKLASIIESIARTEKIKIVLLGNTVSRSCPVLERFTLSDIKLGETRCIYDNYGLLVVAYMEDPKSAPEFVATANSSVSGRLAALLGEDHLENNIFRDDNFNIIPQKRENSKQVLVLYLDYGVFKFHSTTSGKKYVFKINSNQNAKCLKLNNFIDINGASHKKMLQSWANRNLLYFDNAATGAQIFNALGLVY